MKAPKPQRPANLRKVTLYCDGACRGNPGVGGYAAILECGRHEKVLSGAAADTDITSGFERDARRLQCMSVRCKSVGAAGGASQPIAVGLLTQ